MTIRSVLTQCWRFFDRETRNGGRITCAMALIAGFVWGNLHGKYGYDDSNDAEECVNPDVPVSREPAANGAQFFLSPGLGNRRIWISDPTDLKGGSFFFE